MFFSTDQSGNHLSDCKPVFTNINESQPEIILPISSTDRLKKMGNYGEGAGKWLLLLFC